MFFTGRYFTGRLKWLYGQGIETEFFWFLLPLVPIRSLYVIKKLKRGRQGIGIKLNLWSVAKAYLVWWPVPVSSVLFFAYDLPLYWIAASLGLSIGVALLGITPRCKQRQIRQVLGQVLGINAMPQWLDDFNRQHLHQRSLQKLKHRTGEALPSLDHNNRTPQRWTYKCLLAYYVYQEQQGMDNLQVQELDELLSRIYPGKAQLSSSPS